MIETDYETLYKPMELINRIITNAERNRDIAIRKGEINEAIYQVGIMDGIGRLLDSRNWTGKMIKNDRRKDKYDQGMSIQEILEQFNENDWNKIQQSSTKRM
jgi:hypothetical protein